MRSRTGLRPHDSKCKEELAYLKFGEANLLRPPLSLLNGARHVPQEPDDCIPISDSVRKINGFVNVSVGSIQHSVIPEGFLDTSEPRDNPKLAIQEHAYSMQEMNKKLKSIKEYKLRLFQDRTQSRVKSLVTRKEEAEQRKLKELKSKIGRVLGSCKLYSNHKTASRASPLMLRAQQVRAGLEKAYSKLGVLSTDKVAAGAVAKSKKLIVSTRLTEKKVSLRGKLDENLQYTPPLPFWDRGISSTSRLTRDEEAELLFEMRRIKMEDERKAVHEKRGGPNDFVKSLQSKAKKHQDATEMLVMRPDDEDMMLPPSREYEMNSPTNPLPSKEKKKEKKRRQRKEASKRFNKAMKRELKEELKRKGIAIPAPCSCKGVSFFDPVTQKLHKNNCPFYNNPKGYNVAFIQLVKGLNVSAAIVKSLE